MIMTITCSPGKKTESRLLKDSSSDGFTIVETLISIIILTIVLTGGIAIYFNTEAISTMTAHKKIATEIVNLRMEELRMMTYTDFNNQYTLASPAGPRNFNDPNVSPDPALTVGRIPATRTIIVAEDANKCPLSDHKLVGVQVSWTETTLSPRMAGVETCFTP